MASNDRLRMEGLLLEKEQRARHVAVNIYGYKDRVRALVDRHQAIDALDSEALRVAVYELMQADQEFEQIKAEIHALREDLGKPNTEIR